MGTACKASAYQFLIHPYEGSTMEARTCAAIEQYLSEMKNRDYRDFTLSPPSDENADPMAVQTLNGFSGPTSSTLEFWVTFTPLTPPPPSNPNAVGMFGSTGRFLAVCSGNATTAAAGVVIDDIENILSQLSDWISLS